MSVRRSIARLKSAVVQSDDEVQRVVEGLLGVRPEALHEGRGTAKGKVNANILRRGVV